MVKPMAQKRLTRAFFIAIGLFFVFPASAQLAYKFDWSVLWRPPYGRWMLQGILLTLQLGIISWIIALFLGVIIGAIRTFPWKPLRAIGTAYVEIFRNIPLMVQLFFWFYAVPPLISPALNRLPGLGYYCAIFGLGIYTASRVAEHVRSGLGSVPQGQRFAALSTGLSQLQMYRYVIIPYAIRVMIPPITTEFLTIFKNSSLAMTIGVLEVMGMTHQIGEYTFHYVEAFTGAIIVYLTIGLSVVGFMGWVESKLKIPGLIRRG